MMVKDAIESHGNEVIATAGPAAWRGRDDGRGHHVDVGVAVRRFNYALRQTVPGAFEAPLSTQEASS